MAFDRQDVVVIREIRLCFFQREVFVPVRFVARHLIRVRAMSFFNTHAQDFMSVQPGDERIVVADGQAQFANLFFFARRQLEFAAAAAVFTVVSLGLFAYTVKRLGLILATVAVFFLQLVGLMILALVIMALSGSGRRYKDPY